MSKQNLKQKVLKELKKDSIPDLKFLYSKEMLEIALELLEELLKEEKKNFKKKLKIKDKEISFETFEEFSLLDYFYSLLDHLQNIKSSKKIREIIEKIEPRLIDFSNEIAYNKRYYEMIVYCRKNCKLSKEQKRILDEDIKAYKVRWIELDKKKQEKLKQLNKDLRKLSQKMWNNTLDSENEFSYHLKDDKYLKDFPKDSLSLARKKAKEEWKKGYLFDSSSSFYTNIMKYCSSSKVRRDFLKARSSFASSWKYDNRKIILEILKLREEKAKILGFKNYSELSLVFKMAKSPQEIKDLLEWIYKKAKNKAKKEIEEVKEYNKLEDIKDYDLAFYNRILKEEKYKFDEKKLKKYFEFNRVLKGLFKIAKKLYNLKFEEIEIDSYHKDIKFYKVYKDDKFISYFMTDYFFRAKKRSWAWANNLRPKFFKKGFQKYPLVINVCNFEKQKKDTLLSLWDVWTLFHEFWHAIHEILSSSKYADLSGMNVEWDFVEVPSQIMENWWAEEESLNLFARHIKSWEKIKKEVFKKLKKLKQFWTWNFYLRQLEFALLDLELHSSKIAKDIEKLDEKILKITNKLSIFKKDKDYKQYCSFTHIFDWGYASWYYSYIRAEIIEADIWWKFKKQWIFNKIVSKRFLDKILSKWSQKEAKNLFKDFMWRDVKLKAFLKRQGF